MATLLPKQTQIFEISRLGPIPPTFRENIVKGGFIKETERYFPEYCPKLQSIYAGSDSSTITIVVDGQFNLYPIEGTKQQFIYQGVLYTFTLVSSHYFGFENKFLKKLIVEKNLSKVYKNSLTDTQFTEGVKDYCAAMAKQEAEFSEKQRKLAFLEVQREREELLEKKRLEDEAIERRRKIVYFVGAGLVGVIVFWSGTAEAMGLTSTRIKLKGPQWWFSEATSRSYGPSWGSATTETAPSRAPVLAQVAGPNVVPKSDDAVVTLPAVVARSVPDIPTSVLFDYKDDRDDLLRAANALTSRHERSGAAQFPSSYSQCNRDQKEVLDDLQDLSEVLNSACEKSQRRLLFGIREAVRRKGVPASIIDKLNDASSTVSIIKNNNLDFQGRLGVLADREFSRKFFANPYDGLPRGPDSEGNT